MDVTDMIRLLMNDGTTIEATTMANAVQQLRDMQWGAPQPKREYMTECAERVRMLTGDTLDTSNADAFVAGLHKAGLVTTIETTGADMQV